MGHGSGAASLPLILNALFSTTTKRVNLKGLSMGLQPRLYILYRQNRSAMLWTCTVLWKTAIAQTSICYRPMMMTLVHGDSVSAWYQGIAQRPSSRRMRLSLAEVVERVSWLPARIRNDSQLRGCDPEVLLQRALQGTKSMDESLVKRSPYHNVRPTNSDYELGMTQQDMGMPRFTCYERNRRTFHMEYRWDKRGVSSGLERLHCNMAFTCDVSLFANMVVNPPPC